MTEKCIYCDKPAWTSGVTPPMCQRHFDMALLMSRVKRAGEPVTVQAVLRVYLALPVEKRNGLSIKERSIKHLLPGMLETVGA